MPATPPFPKIPSFLPCLTVLEYYGNRLTCTVMLRQLSKKAIKYRKAHDTQIRAAIPASRLKVYKFRQVRGFRRDFHGEDAGKQIDDRQVNCKRLIHL